MKRIVCLFLAFACLSGVCFAAGGMDNFGREKAYQEGIFPDVSENDWFSGSVAGAYELGLMNGNDDGTFAPRSNVTIAQSLALAARLRRIYEEGTADFEQGSPWYEVYSDYCLEKGIVYGRYDDYNAPATRRQFAAMMARALPAEALQEINTVTDGSIPDVRTGETGAKEIYLLYRAGILTGNDDYGTFAPETPIERAAVAAIVTRLADPSQRREFTLKEIPKPVPPVLTKQVRAGDNFFNNAAIIGNSFVDGLRSCANIKTMTYFWFNGATVFSVLTTKEITLADGTRCTQLEALARHQYSKVYIQLGINEAYMTPDAFKAQYGKVVDAVREAEPKADIYIMAILPVTRRSSESSSYFTRDKVMSLNAALYELAEEKGCWYLNDYDPIAGEDGYLPEENAGSDGIHFAWNGIKYAEWEEVIRTYYNKG